MNNFAKYANSISDRHSEAIKSILTAIMVADNKIHKSELRELVKSFRRQFSRLNQNWDLDEKWLKDNISEIGRIVRGPNKNRWLALQFLKLRDFPNKETALKDLWEIAMADGELHESESAIIDKALWLWKKKRVFKAPAGTSS